MFVTIFFSIYFLSNYYVLRRLWSLFEIRPGWRFVAVLIFCSLGYLVAAILNSLFANFLTRIFHTISALWMGVGLLLLSCLVVYEIINLFTKSSGPLTAVTILIVCSLLTIYSITRANMIQITNLDIDSTVDMDIVQICDVHLGSVGKEFLRRVVEKTNTLEADVVLIAGDLVDSYRELTPEVIGLLNGFKADVFFVTGNHERYANWKKVFQRLKNTKIRVLKNEVVDYNGIQIIGIDDSRNNQQVAMQLNALKIDSSKYSILTYHRPVGLKAAAKAGIDLMLTGHTHNGQIFPFNYFVRGRFKYTKGLFKEDGCQLWVSTGTGTWGPKMRLGSKNEITMIKLRKNKTQ